MIGFDELVYNIRVLTKKPFEIISQTLWLDIFKFRIIIGYNNAIEPTGINRLLASTIACAPVSSWPALYCTIINRH
jgi:hypothetical protein